MVARQLAAASHFPGQFSCKASGHGRAMLVPTKVFRQPGPEIFRATARFSPPPPAGGAPSQRGPREGAHLSESEIRRGAFYMRPRKFALSQAGTGGYGIRPYVFEGRALPVPCPLCQHHQRQLYKHGCRLLVLLHRRGAVYLPDCHIQLKLLLVFIHKL